MKALVYTGPESMSFQDAPEPQPGPDEVLVEVAHVGICGSDMHGFLGHDDRRPAPLILGHEAAGTIVGGDLAGQRVAINPLVPCGRCKACTSGRENLCPDRQLISIPPREGAFAERLAIPRENVVAVPEGVPLGKAALTEPLSCGWHGVRLGLEALEQPPETALVLGGGAIGVGSALCLAAQANPTIQVVEPNPIRRAYLERHGFVAIAPDDAPTDVDIVVDGVGYAQTRAAASAAVRPGGVIVHIGLGSGEGGLDIRRMTLQEITFIGTYCFTKVDFRATAEAIFDGRLGPLDWPEHRPLADGAQAFADIRAGQVEAPKVILDP